jgi:Calx-beta domain/CARDB/Peptidase M10 serralysin C terminal
LSANVNLRLLSSGGGEIQATGSGNLNSATIGQSLDPGTYYLQISLPAATQGTNYSLSSSIVAQLPRLDLLGTGFDVVQEPLNVGDGFDVNFQVYNAPINGRSVSARAFRVGFYLSPDSTITTGDRLLGFYDVSAIAAGGFLSQTTRLTLPNTTDTFWSGGNQTYFIGMVVDSLGAVTEGNETNNASRGPQSDFDDVAITVIRPVVTIAATDSSAGEPNNPGQLTITRTGSTATTLTVSYTIDGTATNGVDYTSLGRSATIAAGQTSVVVPISVIDDTLVEGDETVILSLNSSSGYSLGSSSTGTVTIGDDDRIDLVGSFFDVTSVSLGSAQSSTVTFRVQNLGNINSQIFNVGFYLSTDQTITTSDYRVGSQFIDGLAANSTSDTLIGTFQLPNASNSFWSGSKTYYVGLVIDPNNYTVETNKTNNASQGLGIDYDSIAVSIEDILPDLRGSFFDAPEPLTAGSSSTLNFQIQNAGTLNAGRFGVSFYLSDDSTITRSDRRLSEYHFDDLAANTTTALLSTALNLPIAGDVIWNGSKTYSIGMIIDEQSRIWESDDTNNANRDNGLDWDDVAITVSSTALVDPIAATGVASSNPETNTLLVPDHSYWNTSANGGIITYSFYKPSSGPYSGSETVSEVAEKVKIDVHQILNLIESYIDVRFVEVADTSTHAGAIRYMLSDMEGYAYAYYPGLGIGGDVHLGSAYASDFSAGYGSEGYMVLIHETLHALGLKHPGNYDGSGTGEPPFLAGGEDNTTNTVMSYNTAGSGAISPMSYDIRALQYLYGVKPARTTNTTYNFRSPTGYRVDSQFFGSTTIPLKQTLWDTGGVDTLDFSNVSISDDYYFDLWQGGILTTQSAYNAVRYTALGAGGSYTTSALGTAIAFNTTIENLINSRSNDTIIANSANNVFKGYALGTFTGNDTIEQSSSADVLELSGYSLASLTATISGTDLTIGLGTNGTVQIKDYYGTHGSMKIWVNGTYYTYRASGGWQIAAAPALLPMGAPAPHRLG